MNPKDRIGRRKPGVTDMPQSAILWCAKAMKTGADKYGSYNWRTEEVSLSVYLDAAFRHQAKIIDGKWLDEESGLPHAAHIMACMAILLDAYYGGNLDVDLVTHTDPEMAGVTELVVEMLTANGEQ